MEYFIYDPGLRNFANILSCEYGIKTIVNQLINCSSVNLLSPDWAIWEGILYYVHTPYNQIKQPGVNLTHGIGISWTVITFLTILYSNRFKITRVQSYTFCK